MPSAEGVTPIHTVVVMVRGRLIDCLSFRTPQDAEEYKRLVRRWALQDRVQVQLWSQDSRLLLSQAAGASRSGLAHVA